jgi:hypothetical protein
MTAMGAESQSSLDASQKIESASRRCAELVHRVYVSQAIVSSALELPRVSPVLKETIRRRHLSGETVVRDVLTKYNLIVPIEAGDPVGAEQTLPVIAEGLAEQTAINAEMVISAAVVILSHSTADDVFTEACKLAIDIDPMKWVPLVNLQREVTLQSLKEKGSDGVFEDELQRFKTRLADKSLPNRAKLLFAQIPIRMNRLIGANDRAYFRMSRLEEGDDLRHKIIHRNGLPETDPASGTNFGEFFHEAAHTAVRSVGAAYGIPLDTDYFRSLFLGPGLAGPSNPLDSTR